MAIGKVNAYATVQAPNVDFGDIALNAQKFQDTDLERQKELKVAQAKTQKIDAKEVLLDPASIVNGTLENAMNSSISEEQDKLNNYYQLESNGNTLTLEQRTDKNNAIQYGKSLKGMQDLVNSALKEIPDSIKGSSPISKNYVKGWENLSQGTGIAGINRTKGNDIEVTFYDTKDGKYIDDGSGEPKILTEVDDDGNEVPFKVSLKNIANGNFKNKFYKSNDLSTLIGKYSKTVGAYDTKIENGTVTTGHKLFTSENINTLNETIKSDLRKDRKYMADIMSQISGDPNNSKKYGIQGDYDTIKKEYGDKEYASAEKFISDRVRGSLDTSFSRTIDEPTRININNGGPKKPIPTIQEKPQIQTVTHYNEIPGGIKPGEKRTPAYKEKMYLLPALRGQKIDVSGVDSNVEGFGKALGADGKSIRYFLKYTPTSNVSTASEQGEGETASKVNIGGKIKMQPQYLYFDKDASEFMNVASQFVNPRTGSYFNNDNEVRGYLDNKLKNAGLGKTTPKTVKTTNTKPSR